MESTSHADLVIAWVDKTGAYDEYLVQARVKTAGGLTAIHTLGGGVSDPVVAPIGSDGHALVAWVGTDSAGVRGSEVLVAEYEPGSGFTSAESLGYGDPFAGGQPAIAADTAGDATIIWRDGVELRRARRGPDGAWGSDDVIAAGVAGVPGHLGSGMSSTGDATHVWTEDGTVYTATDAKTGEVSTPVALGNGASADIEVNASGGAIISFVGDSPLHLSGPVKLAVRPPGGGFAPVHDVGRTAGHRPDLALSADGHFTLVWEDVHITSDSSASFDGVWSVSGTVTGGAGSPERVTTAIGGSPVQVAVDPVGNAAIFYRPWDRPDQHIVRRAVNGFYGQERAVGACPPHGPYGNVAHVDSSGNATLLWKSNRRGGNDGLYLSQDEPSSTFAPGPCPPPAPSVVVTPKQPRPGDEVTFDATNSLDTDADETEISWDLDGDGSYEVSGQPVAKKVFPVAGTYPVGVKVYADYADGGSGWSARFDVAVDPAGGSAPDFTPATRAAPPALPDENPWPLESRDKYPAGGHVIPGDYIPPAPPYGGWTGSTPTFPTQTPAKPLFAMSAVSKVRLKMLLKSGLAVRLDASEATKVRTRLYWLKGKKRVLADTETMYTKRGRTVTETVKPSAKIAKQLKRLKSAKFIVETTALGEDFDGRTLTRRVTAKR